MLFISNHNIDTEYESVVKYWYKNGNCIASYTYDEWGKLLSITTAEEGNKSQLNIAELNPLRYRGYYYDSETGYYYLQSRYYNPELGRFISADGFEYLDTSNRLNANAYIYCWNCPTAFEDAEGTTPKLSIDKQTVLNFLSNTSAKIKDGIETGFKDLYNGIAASFQKLQSEHSASIEKLKFYYMNPGEFSSEFLSGLFGKDIHIEFKLLKEIRSRIVSAYQTIKEGIKNINIKDSNEEDGIAAYALGKSDSSCGSGWGSPSYAISVILTEIFVCFDLQEIARRLKVSFAFDGLEDYKTKKTNLYRDWFNNGNWWTASTDVANTIAGYISLAADFVPKWEIKAALKVLPYATSALSDFSGRYLSAKGGLIMLLYDWSTSLASGLLGKSTSLGDSILEVIMDSVFGKVFDFFGKQSAENYAYNWYLML